VLARSRLAGLSARSVRYVHTILHRALKDAVRWGRLVRNPCEAADPPRASAHVGGQIKSWTADTLAEFLERSRTYGDRYHPLWVLLATTGARRGEILGLLDGPTSIWTPAGPTCAKP